MLFNSLAFLAFFPVVCILYWVLPHKWRNTMLLVASYYFYMNWEPRFALLLVFTTITSWAGAILIEHSSAKEAKGWLTAVLIINLGCLFVFKYLGFFTQTLWNVLSLCGLRLEIPHFSILLPVGISFYTFQALGYAIDVYRKALPAEKNLFTYALFVSFFPQLVAGPIERARNLLPQFHGPHTFDSDLFLDGLKLMLLGYFMKLCIAENVASYVDAVFNNVAQHNGKSILLALFFFSFQIYSDFCGYTLIAIGCARCLGFDLMQNFNHPFLATSAKDVWRRWHISLSSWFADYVYIPLGGSRCSEMKHLRNIMITMILSGLWHGAAWTFVLWGTFVGLWQCASLLMEKHKMSFCLPRPVAMILTYAIFLFSLIFFRSNNIQDIGTLVNRLFDWRGLLFNGEGKPAIVLPLLLIAGLMFKEIKDEFQWDFHLIHHRNQWIAAFSSAVLLLIILLCGSFDGHQFIYFQF